MVCHGADIINEARITYDQANTVQQLRQALGNMIALNVQRAERARAIKRTDPVYFGTCACGCGQDVYGSKLGIHKLYVDHAHGQRVVRRRQKARRQAAGREAAQARAAA